MSASHMWHDLCLCILNGNSRPPSPLCYVQCQSHVTDSKILQHYQLNNCMHAWYNASTLSTAWPSEGWPHPTALLLHKILVLTVHALYCPAGKHIVRANSSFLPHKADTFWNLSLMQHCIMTSTSLQQRMLSICHKAHDWHGVGGQL